MKKITLGLVTFLAVAKANAIAVIGAPILIPMLIANIFMGVFGHSPEFGMVKDFGLKTTQLKNVISWSNDYDAGKGPYKNTYADLKKFHSNLIDASLANPNETAGLLNNLAKYAGDMRDLSTAPLGNVDFNAPTMVTILGAKGDMDTELTGQIALTLVSACRYKKDLCKK